MRNLFSKGLMAAAAVMMFASCSNEEEMVQGPASENDVTIALSVRGTKAASDDMNFAGTNDIKNVAVVPYAGGVAQKPVVWETITAAEAAAPEAQKTQLVSSVNLFKVYGNLTPEQYKLVKDGSFGLGQQAFYLANSQVAAHETYYAPHAGLYYFKNASDFQVNSTAASWDAVGDAWTTNSGNVEGAKFIKISGVNYAVGSLAVAVMDGGQNIFVNTQTDAPAASVEDAVEITGIVIKGQKDFDLDFKTTGAGKDVYDTAAKATFGTDITGKGDAAANGNIFVVVAPTADDEKVQVSIEFKVKENYKFTASNGTEFTAGENFYLGMQLSPADNSVFKADYLTKVNATVKNWGLATETPVDVTDAEIGVVFDTAWEEGNLYEVEL